MTHFAPHRKNPLHRSAAQRKKHPHRQPDNTRLKLYQSQQVFIFKA
jgi:hypothetical protein